MKQKILHYIKEIAIFIVMLTVVTNAVSLYKSSDLNKAPLEISSFKLLDNTTYSLDKKEVTLIHFWATWCPTCKAEASNIDSIAKSAQVVTIAIKSGTAKEVQNYLQEHKLKFNVVNDEEGILSKEFNIAAFPTTLIYNREGELVFSDVGYTSTLGLWLRLAWARL